MTGSFETESDRSDDLFEKTGRRMARVRAIFVAYGQRFIQLSKSGLKSTFSQQFQH